MKNRFVVPLSNTPLGATTTKSGDRLTGAEDGMHVAPLDDLNSY